MTASLSGVFNLQEFTDAGALLASGRLYTCAQGTTTLKVAYTDKAGTIAHTYTSDGVGGQYIGLSARGELPAPLYLAPGSYDIALKTATGATVWTRRADPIDDLAEALRTDLANEADAAKGAGLVAYNPELSYPSETVGKALNESTSLRPSWYIGTTDWAVKTQALIDAKAAAGGGRIYIPEGRYPTSQINLKSGVYLVGAGEDATEFYALGDHPTFAAIGSISDIISRGGVKDMLVRGKGKSSANGHGIYLAWVNRMKFDDVRFHGTRYGMYFSNVWETKFDNLHADGAGADQNYIGFYGAEVDPANQNNAVNAINCIAQGVEAYGFRLINFNGSKFTNCEAMDGIHAWYLGNPTTGTERVRWGHFSNCLGDTSSSDNWRLEKGAAAAFEQVQFSNCWAGTSGRHGWRIAGVSAAVFSSPMVVASQQHAMQFDNSSRCVVSGAQLLAYDVAGAGHAGIALIDSLYIGVGGASHIYSTSGTAKAIVESGTSDLNTVTGNSLQSGFTKIGAGSVFVRNQGARGEKSGSASIASGATSVTVTHGMASRLCLMTSC
jgi:hypothetical protein